MPERGRSRRRVRRPAAPDLSGAQLQEQADHWRTRVRSTPGRFALLGLVLVMLVLGSGLAIGLTTNARVHRLDVQRHTTDPVADASQDLYASLSFADVSASTAFLAGGLQPRATIDDYDGAIAVASSALSTAGGGAAHNGQGTQDLVSAMANRLPVYTGLIATANANNRSGNPVGVSYLTEASNLMQQDLLPHAEQLYTVQSSSLADASDRNASVDWIPLVVTAVAFAALIVFQFYVARRSNRVLNPGLLVASVCVGAMFLWTVVAGVLSAQYSHRANTESVSALNDLTTARITAQQARTDETRTLLQRDGDSSFADSFAERVESVHALLDEHARNDDAGGDEDADTTEMRDAREHLTAWERAHGQMSWDLSSGDYRGAVAVATDTDESSAASQFSGFDDALAERISSVRAHGQDLTDSSARATEYVVVGTGILAALGALAVIFGLWPRVSEYR